MAFKIFQGGIVMKTKHTILQLLNSALLGIMLVTANNVLTVHNKEIRYISVEGSSEFKSAFKEPMLVEIEVSTCTSECLPEPVYELVEEPIYYDQAIGYYFDITQPSGLTSEELAGALGDSRSGMYSVVDHIIEAEATYGINALYLTAVLGYESGWGRYETGWNNIAGWKGNGGTWSDFSSKYECIMTVADGLINDFVYTQGPYVGDIAQRYCPDYAYTETLLQIMSDLDYNL